MRGVLRTTATNVICVLIFASLPVMVLAATPVNDTYKSAIAISSLPYTQAIDLTDATDDPLYPPCEAAAHRRIWYTFTAPTSEAIRVSVGGDQTAELATWKVVSGGPKGIQLDRCAVDGQDLVAPLVGGAKYAISVGQWVTAPPMIATLTISVQAPPVNDDFANAEPITSVPFQATIDQAVSAAATSQPGEPTPSCASDVLLTTVWYRLSPAKAEQVTWTLQYISSMGVYRGTSFGSLTEIGCTNGPDQGSFNAAAGDTYYFQVVVTASRDTILSVDAATPPANDAFADATTVDALPATFSTDLTLATTESGEPLPSCAGGGGQTAWWSFTAAQTGTLTISAGSYSQFTAAYTGAGLASLVEQTCLFGFGYVPLHLIAGERVLLQVGFWSPQAGTAGLTLDFQAAPGNDDFANALPIAQGDSVAVDLTGATVETGEPNPPSCAYWPGGSVWYDYTGTGESVGFALSPGSTYFAIAAYTGSDVASLSALGCRLFDGPPLTIRPLAGQHVRLQVWSYDYCCGKTTTLSVVTPGAPVPAFATSIGDPSTFDDVTFVDQTQDPGGNPDVAWTWTFGDGTTSTDQYPIHRYAADGTYPVTLSVVTSDGRTGTATQDITIRTHDVGIAKFMVPSTARAGQTKPITVGIGNRHYPETVTVELFVSRRDGSYQSIGSVTQSVPVLGAGQTVSFSFSYLFTRDDATAGKVTFQAVATVTTARDAFPSDNQAISLATKVSK